MINGFICIASVFFLFLLLHLYSFISFISLYLTFSFRRGFRNFLLCRCSRGIYSSDPSELDRTVVTSVSHSNKKIGYIKNKLHHKHAGQCNRTRANGRSSCTCHLVAECKSITFATLDLLFIRLHW